MANADITTKKPSDRPIPMEINLGRSALQIKTTCRDCIHFKRMANPGYKKPCLELGVIEESKPCDRFAANPENVKFTDVKHLSRVAVAIQDLGERDLKVLSIIMNQEQKTRRNGFKFGQFVYFKLYNGDYLRNYVQARVIWADAKYVHMQGVDGYLATLYLSSVLNENQWKKVEGRLIQDNKIYDPNRARYDKKPTKAQLELQKIDKPLPLDLSAALGQEKFLTTSNVNANKRESRRHIPLDKILTVR